MRPWHPSVGHMYPMVCVIFHLATFIKIKVSLQNFRVSNVTYRYAGCCKKFNII
jgi:hypothetical protein